MNINKQKDKQHRRTIQEGYQPIRGTIDRSNPPGNESRNGTDRGSPDRSKQDRNR